VSARSEVAAAEHKAKICHFSEAVPDNAETGDVDESQPAMWVVIEVSKNSSHYRALRQEPQTISETGCTNPEVNPVPDPADNHEVLDKLIV
jgi:hypothetical protein